MPDTSHDVLLAVLTYKRPAELLRLFESLVPLVVPDDVRLRIAVIDNDPAGSARETVAGLPLDVEYVHETRPGISCARNRALDVAADLKVTDIAFVDDDETVHPEWLLHLLQAQVEFGADVVTGPAVPIFSTRGSDSSVVRAGFFDRPGSPHGTRRGLAAGNNLLVRSSLFVTDGRAVRRFDEALSLIGGEDTKYFTQAAREGAVIIWAADAVVYDHIPDSRLRWQWVAKRAIRSGWSDATLEYEEKSLRSLRCVLMGLSRIVYGVVRLISSWLRLRRPTAADYWPALRGVGFVMAGTGVEAAEYKRGKGVDPTDTAA